MHDIKYFYFKTAAKRGHSKLNHFRNWNELWGTFYKLHSHKLFWFGANSFKKQNSINRNCRHEAMRSNFTVSYAFSIHCFYWCKKYLKNDWNTNELLLCTLGSESISHTKLSTGLMKYNGKGCCTYVAQHRMNYSVPGSLHLILRWVTSGLKIYCYFFRCTVF